MYYAISEKTDRRSGNYFNEGELLAELDEISVDGDFWDVYNGNGIAYYYTPQQKNKIIWEGAPLFFYFSIILVLEN